MEHWSSGVRLKARLDNQTELLKFLVQHPLLVLLILVHVTQVISILGCPVSIKREHLLSSLVPFEGT